MRAAFTRIQFDAYHPLHLLSYLPDRLLWPTHPAGFHAVNLALFVAGVLLVFGLARRHVAAPAAFAACLVFALHPLRVEPVAWISARKDLLALIFFVLALRVEDRRATDARRPSAGALALFACALLSKSSAMCFPPVLAAWLLWVKRAPLRTALWRATPHAALAIAAGLTIALVYRDHALLLAARPAALPIDVAASFATFTARLAWPAGLAALYPDAAAAPLLAALLWGAGVVALAVTWRRLPPPARFAAVAYHAALAPVANLLPIYFRFGDRYTLLAGAVLVLPFAALCETAWASPRRWLRAAVTPGLAVVVVAELAVTVPLAGSWHDSRALWARTVAAQPDTYLARLKYGETLRDARAWDEGAAQYEAALRLAPDRRLAYVALFYLHATRAEVEERAAPGAANYWLGELGGAEGDTERYNSLRRRVSRTCAPCADALLRLGLRLWPQPDAVLLAEAARALAAGATPQARLYLAAVVDRTNTTYLQLAAASAP